MAAFRRPTRHSSSPSPSSLSSLSDPKLERSFRGHSSPVLSVSFHPSLSSVASAGGDDQLVLIFPFKPQLRPVKLAGHRGSVLSVAFSPDGASLASGSTDNSIRVWEPTVRAKHVVLRSHSAPVRSVAWSASGSLLLSASDDKTCRLFSAPALRFQSSLVGHTHWVRSAVFSPDERLIATASDDRTVRLWDTHSHSALHVFPASSSPAPSVCVAFHPHGSVIAAAASTHLRIYDSRSHLLLQHYHAHSSALTSVGFHPSGHHLLSSSSDGSMKIWDLRKGHQLYTIRGHGEEGGVNAVSWSADGGCFASGGDDGRVMCWRWDWERREQEDREEEETKQEEDRQTGAAARELQRPARASQLASSASSLASSGFSSPALSAADLQPAAPHPPLDIAPLPSALRPPPTIRQPEPHPAVNLAYDCDYRHPNPLPAAAAGSSSSSSAAFPSSAGLSSAATAADAGGFTAAASVSLPAEVTAALQQIVTQLDVLSRTLRIFEIRLSAHEDKLSRIEKEQKALHRANVEATIDRELSRAEERAAAAAEQT